MGSTRLRSGWSWSTGLKISTRRNLPRPIGQLPATQRQWSLVTGKLSVEINIPYSPDNQPDSRHSMINTAISAVPAKCLISQSSGQRIASIAWPSWYLLLIRLGEFSAPLTAPAQIVEKHELNLPFELTLNSTEMEVMAARIDVLVQHKLLQVRVRRTDLSPNIYLLASSININDCLISSSQGLLVRAKSQKRLDTGERQLQLGETQNS
ncbi:putative Bgh-specific protein [Blumeria hordei DH14]|uniref:Putative Bgh-specific protein n=1 Tax=Blumeria graminis f. sp. hordei (strain DH14) TaxID=546991 RepID=N1JNS8_BLUG1|nr:putative Bgh-specific protein [Blumeria hordei DH14]